MIKARLFFFYEREARTVRVGNMIVNIVSTFYLILTRILPLGELKNSELSLTISRLPYQPDNENE